MAFFCAALFCCGAFAQSEPAEEVSYEEDLRALHSFIGERYAGFKLKGIDWPYIGKIFVQRVQQVETDEEFGMLCLELIAQLADGHCVLKSGKLSPPRPVSPDWSCGAYCLAGANAEPIVYHVAPDTPAARLGIEPGMEVVTLNGMPGRVALARRMSELGRFYGHSSPRALRYFAARHLLLTYKEGDEIELELKRADGSTWDVTVPTNAISRGAPRRPAPVPETSERKTMSYTMLNKNIGYIYVRRMNDEVISGLDAAVGAMQDAKAIVVDIRGNGGGGFDGLKAFTNFVPVTDSFPGDRPRFTGPMALLMDEHSMSAAEGWGSWFVVTDRARIFGRSTGGMSSVKTEFTLPSGRFRARISTRYRHGYLDRPVELLGLQPDVEVYPAPEDLAVGKDTVLEAAKAYLRGEISE